MYLLVNSTLPRQNGQRLKVYRADYRAKNIFIIIVLLLSNFHIYGRRSKILEIKNFTKIIIGLKGEINWILVQKLPKFRSFCAKISIFSRFSKQGDLVIFSWLWFKDSTWPWPNGILIWKPQKIFLTCEMWF